MRTAIKIGICSLAGILTISVSLLLYLLNADLSVHEERIEAALSDIVGHEVHIDGSFELQFGRLTTLTAERISVVAPEWQQEPTLLGIGQLSITLDLWSLYDGPVVIENIDVSDIELRYQKDANSETNWGVGKEADTDVQSGEFDTGLIVFREVRISDFHFFLDDSSRPRPLLLTIEQLSIHPDENGILDLAMNGMANEFPLQASGQLGPLQSLLSGRDVTADLTLTLGQVQLTIDGFVADLAALEGVDLTLNLSGPSIDRVTDILNMPPIAQGAFEINGRVLKRDGSNQVHLDGDLGEIDILVDGAVDRLIGLKAADLKFGFSGPNMKYVAEMFGVDNVRALPFRVIGELQLAGTRIEVSATKAQLGENTVTLDGWLDTRQKLPDLEMSFAASGPDLSVIGPFSQIKGMPNEAFELTGMISKEGSNWHFDNVRARIAENRVTANGFFKGGDGADSEILVEVSGPDISFLEPMTGLQGLPARPYEIFARIRPASAGVHLPEMTAVFGDNRIEVEGIIGTKPGLSGTSINVHAEGPELENIALLADVPLLPDGPFSVAGRIRIEGQQLLLEDATAIVDGAAAAATGSIGLGNDIGDFDLVLSAKGSDIAEMVNVPWLERMAGNAYDLEGHIIGREGQVELDAVRVSVGNLSASINGELADGGKTIDLSVSAKADDAGMLAKLAGIEALPDGAFSAAGRIERKGTDMDFTDAELRIGDIRFSANGTLSSSPLANDSNFRFSASGPELRQLGLPFGISVLPAKTFSISADVNGVPQGFAIEHLVARIGENDIVGSFTADLRDKPQITGSLSATYLDLKGPLLVEEDVSAESTEQAGEFFFSDEPLDAAWLDKVNIAVELELGRLLLRQAEMLDFKIGVKLMDGVLDIDPVAFREQDGRMNAKLHLETRDGVHAVELSVHAENLKLDFWASSKEDLAALPPLGADMQFTGTGKSLHQIMAASHGSIRIQQGAGRFRKSRGAAIFGDLLSQIVRTLNPLASQDEFAYLECSIYRVGIENGMATIETFAVQMDRMRIFVRGSANLNDEKLDISFRIVPREGIGVSLGSVANSFFKLGGTMNEPQFKIDPTASVTTTGAAIATGGLSLLAKGLWDRMSVQSDICKELELPAP